MFGIIIPILLFYISLNATYSYLSATAYSDKNTVDISVIKVEFSEKSNNIDANTITASSKLIPGKTIELSGKVQNTGNEAIYAIITFEIETTKVGGETYKTKKYYTLENGKLKEIIILTDNYSNYAFSMEANDITENFSVEHYFDFYKYDNTYINANVKYSLSVNAIQSKNIENNVVATKHLILA